MESFCLETQWKSRLVREGWSIQAADAVVRSKATSTWRTCNSALTKFLAFLQKKGMSLELVQESDIAQYLHSLASQSSRPQGVLRNFSAAMSTYRQATGSGFTFSPT